VVATTTTAVSVVATTMQTATTSYGSANAVAEFGVLAVVLVSVGVVLFVRTRNKPKSTRCSECGFSNPPFARGFCVNCGKPLRRA
jgi:uncharacterized paraquat-inducible protein A